MKKKHSDPENFSFKLDSLCYESKGSNLISLNLSILICEMALILSALFHRFFLFVEKCFVNCKIRFKYMGWLETWRIFTLFLQSCSLPVPWFLFSLINGLQPVPVSSNGLFCAIVLLFLMLLFVISSIASCKWRMNKILGFTMFLLYFVFLIISVMLEDRIISCPVSVWVTVVQNWHGSENHARSYRTSYYSNERWTWSRRVNWEAESWMQMWYRSEIYCWKHIRAHCGLRFSPLKVWSSYPLTDAGHLSHGDE